MRLIISTLILISLVSFLAFGDRPEAPYDVRLTQEGPCSNFVRIEWKVRGPRARIYIHSYPDNEFIHSIHWERTWSRVQVFGTNVTHEYRIFARNDDGESDSVYVKIKVEAPPEKPILEIIDNCNKVTLKFSRRSRSVDEIVLAVKREGGSYIDRARFSYTYDSGPNTYIDELVTPGVKHYYRMMSHNECGWSDPQEITATPRAKPSHPNDFRATADPCESTIVLDWEPVENATSYYLFRSTEPDSPLDSYRRISISDRSMSTTYRDSSLNPGKTYFYALYAQNDCGHSDFEQTSATAHDIPNRPANLKAIPRTTQACIKLEWEDVANEEGYEIFRRTGDGHFEEITDVSQNVTTYIDGVDPRDRTYYYKIRAYNRCGRSQFSDETDSALKEIKAIRSATRRILKIPNQILQKYTGEYIDQRNPRLRLTITQQGNNLNVSSASFRQFKLSAKSKTEFFEEDKDIHLKFNTDKSGKVISVTLLMGGKSKIYKKK